VRAQFSHVPAHSDACEDTSVRADCKGVLRVVTFGSVGYNSSTEGEELVLLWLSELDSTLLCSVETNYKERREPIIGCGWLWKNSRAFYY